MSNPNFTIVVDQKVNSQSSQKLNSKSISSDSISANSLITTLFNANCMNGYHLMQSTLYTPNSYKSTTSFSGWLYTYPSYNPVAAGTLDPNFFVLPVGAVVVGITAANLNRLYIFNATSFSVGFAPYAAPPFPTLLLDTVLAATVNTAGGVAAGNSISDMPRASAALGSAGAAVAPAGYTVTLANTGMNLDVIGTTLAYEALVFKLSYFVPQ